MYCFTDFIPLCIWKSQRTVITGQEVFVMDNHYNHFKKIDAHSHIGKFGSPFNIDFDLQRLTEQMEEFNIEKTILCPAGCHLNEELKTAYQAAPDKIIPLCWVNAPDFPDIAVPAAATDLPAHNLPASSHPLPMRSASSFNNARFSLNMSSTSSI